jgi:glutamate synthase domain-containing protein 3
MEMVGLEEVESEEDAALLRGMVEDHLHWTGSSVARRVLDEWEDLLPRFVKVMPNDLKKVLREKQEAELEVASR